MKAPAFMLYAGDFLSSPDVQLMSNSELGAYCRLLFSSWLTDRPGYLANDEDQIRRLARLSVNAWQTSRAILLRKFPEVQDDSAWRYNPRLAQEATKQASRRERLAANGRLGGRPRNQLVTEEHFTSLTPEQQKAIVSSEKLQLSTNKQLPALKQAVAKASISSSITSIEVKSKATKVALSASLTKKGFTPPTLAQVQAYAAEAFPHNPEALVNAPTFFNYFESNGWRVGGKTPMKKWEPAFSNWMNRQSQFSQTTGSAAPTRAQIAPKANRNPNCWS
jgi:uncharacterized protein YdaU (DUF1376 family)